jgi:phenylalanyl-tRNA synthetase beta chain
MNTVNSVVDAANLVMLETGQPLHVFDLDKISGAEINVRRANRSEKVVTLDKEAYELDKDILVIADLKGVLAIAGIKGGKKAEVDKKTRNIVIESANFNSIIIRAGSKKIDLKTDASWRFEHGLDLALTESGINRAAGLIAELTKGKVCQGLVDFYPKKAIAKKIVMDFEKINSVAGVKIPTSEVKRILKSLGFDASGKSSTKLLVKVPTFRLDISIPEDLIEEIVRIYGYHKIPSSFPIAALVPPIKNQELFWEYMAKDILKESGFTEIYTNSFVNKKQAKNFGFNLDETIELQNPPSADYQYLRPSLIPNLVGVFNKNKKFLKDIKIFETGKIFKKARIKEKKALTAIIEGESFYKAKGVVDSLLNGLGVSDVWYDEYQPTPEESKISVWHKQRCAEIKVGQKEIGFLGEISPQLIDSLSIGSALTILDIDFDKLQKVVSEEQEYRPISPYPTAVRDIALLIPRKVLVGQVLIKIQQAGANLVKDVDLFDIYEGDEIPDGKKNLAFHIIYQSKDKTLSAKEIDKVHNKIIESLEADPEWEVRK